MTDLNSTNDDPKGLIRESYRIDGITMEDCKTIFFDWACSLPDGVDDRQALERLLAVYGTSAPDHPMTKVIREGTSATRPKGRRGGRAARLS